VLMEDPRPLKLSQETALAGSLEKKLRPLLDTRRELDIRFLGSAPPAFQYQVIKCRALLWEGNPEMRVRFEQNLIREYMDFRYYEELYRQAFARRLKEGVFGRRPQIRSQTS